MTRSKIAIVTTWNPRERPSFTAFLEECEGWLKAKSPSSRFVVGNTMEDFTPFTHEIKAIIFVSVNGSPDTLRALWRAVGTEHVEWFHNYFAGVDAVSEVLRSLLPPRREERSAKMRTRFTNGRGAFSSSLAEYCLAAMLYFNKQLSRLERQKSEGKWEKFTMHTLTERNTVGFLGFGSIAKRTARMCRVAFGMRVLAYRRRRNPEHETLSTVETSRSSNDAKRVRRAAEGDNRAADVEDEEEEEDRLTTLCDTPEELLRQSDFVISTLPSTPETLDFMNASRFLAMKPSAVFINVGRGSTVDESALVEALTKGTIGGAALDVFKTEPLPSTHPLRAAPNLLLSPHNADFTSDVEKLGWEVCRANLVRIEELEKEIGKETYERMRMTPFDPYLGY